MSNPNNNVRKHSIAPATYFALLLCALGVFELAQWYQGGVGILESLVSTVFGRPSYLLPVWARNPLIGLALVLPALLHRGVTDLVHRRVLMPMPLAGSRRIHAAARWLAGPPLFLGLAFAVYSLIGNAAVINTPQASARWLFSGLAAAALLRFVVRNLPKEFVESSGPGGMVTLPAGTPAFVPLRGSFLLLYDLMNGTVSLVLPKSQAKAAGAIDDGTSDMRTAYVRRYQVESGCVAKLCRRDASEFTSQISELRGGVLLLRNVVVTARLTRNPMGINLDDLPEALLWDADARGLHEWLRDQVADFALGALTRIQAEEAPKRAREQIDAARRATGPGVPSIVATLKHVQNAAWELQARSSELAFSAKTQSRSLGGLFELRISAESAALNGDYASMRELLTLILPVLDAAVREKDSDRTAARQAVTVLADLAKAQLVSLDDETTGMIKRLVNTVTSDAEPATASAPTERRRPALLEATSDNDGSIFAQRKTSRQSVAVGDQQE